MNFRTNKIHALKMNGIIKLFMLLFTFIVSDSMVFT